MPKQLGNECSQPNYLLQPINISPTLSLIDEKFHNLGNNWFSCYSTVTGTCSSCKVQYAERTNVLGGKLGTNLLGYRPTTEQTTLKNTPIIIDSNLQG